MTATGSSNFVVFPDTVIAPLAPVTVKQLALLAKFSAEAAGTAAGLEAAELVASHQQAGTLTGALASAFLDGFHSLPKSTLPPLGAALAAHFALAS